MNPTVSKPSSLFPFSVPYLSWNQLFYLMPLWYTSNIFCKKLYIPTAAIFPCLRISAGRWRASRSSLGLSWQLKHLAQIGGDYCLPVIQGFMTQADSDSPCYSNKTKSHWSTYLIKSLSFIWTALAISL